MIDRGRFLWQVEEDPRQLTSEPDLASSDTGLTRSKPKPGSTLVIVAAMVTLLLLAGLGRVIIGVASAIRRISTLEALVGQRHRVGATALSRQEVEGVLRDFVVREISIEEVPPEYELTERHLPQDLVVVEYRRFGMGVFVLYDTEGTMELLVPDYE